MTRVFIAATRTEERAALQLMLRDLKMEVVGEAPDWDSTFAQVPKREIQMLVVDWDLLPAASSAALESLRRASPLAFEIVLISRLDAYQQAAASAGADTFISQGETAERVAERLRLAAVGTRAGGLPN